MGQAAQSSQLTTGQFEVTWRCNWRCVHCYQDDHTLQALTLERCKELLMDIYLMIQFIGSHSLPPNASTNPWNVAGRNQLLADINSRLAEYVVNKA